MSAIQRLSNVQLYGMLNANATVNINNSMTAAQIQALINEQPKYLNGYVLTFQFADGTYSLSTYLGINGFVGGAVSILGNAGNNSRSVTKSVILNSASGIVLTLNNNAANMIVRYLDCRATDTAYNPCIQLVNNCAVQFQYNYLHSTALAAGNTYGLSAEESHVRCYNNMITNFTFGIRSAFNSTVLSQTDDDNGVGARPIYGYLAEYNGEIGKADSSAITGSTSDNLTGTGGVIR